METLDDWNLRLGYCGCCPMPECPVPAMLCQSRSAESNQWLYPPFVKPDGKPHDRLPTMYGTKDVQWPRSWRTGVAVNYEGWRLNPTVSQNWAEHLQVQTFNGSFDVPGAYHCVDTGNSTQNDTGDHANPTPWGPDVETGTDGQARFFRLFGGGWMWPVSESLSDSTTMVSAGHVTLTPDHYIRTDDSIRYTKGSSAPQLQGAGGENHQFIRYWDVTDHGEFRVSFSDPVTLATLRQDLIGDLAPWPENHQPAEGNSCEARFETNWPEIKEVDWMDQDSVWSISDWGVLSNITGTRFRWKLQSLVEYGEDGEDGDEQPDILNWWRGTTFKITWDILEEPKGWDRMIDDPDYQPPDEMPAGGWPPVPQIADPDRPKRSYFLEDQTWEWTGPGDPQNETSWMSDWYEIPPPEVPGSRRVVNIRFVCYPHSPYGYRPQVTGEAVTLPDP